MSTATATRSRSRPKQSITNAAGLPFDPAMVQLKHCFVDDFYQRDVQPRLVREITEDFNPLQAGVLILSKRTATSYALMDGQQRWRGMTNLDMREWCGLVCYGLRQQEEADLYSRLFNRVGMHSADKFKANLARGDADATTIHEVLDGFGLAIGKSAHRKEIIAAPAAALWILRDCSGSQRVTTRNPALLAKTIEILVAAWPDLDKTVKGQIMLKGLALFLKMNPDIDQDRLILRLSHTTPPALWQDAQDAAKGKRKSVTSDKPGWLAYALGTLYNDRSWKPT